MRPSLLSCVLSELSKMAALLYAPQHHPLGQCCVPRRADVPTVHTSHGARTATGIGRKEAVTAAGAVPQ